MDINNAQSYLYCADQIIKTSYRALWTNKKTNSISMTLTFYIGRRIFIKDREMYFKSCYFIV